MKRVLGLTIGFALFGAGAVHAQGTLDAVQKKGFVQCGVSTGLAGFSQPDSQGVWKGLDVDMCRAVAAAVFGDPSKARFTPTTAVQRFPALQSGEVDVLTRNTTWTLARDTTLGFNFAGVNFYDGQGFMVRKGGVAVAPGEDIKGAKGAKSAPKRSRSITSAKQLNGATVCVQPGTTTELNLSDYFRANKMTFKPVVIEKLEEVTAAYFAGRCDVYTTDISGLVSVRGSRAPKPADHVILPEVISKEPLGPVVRHGDERWFDIVKWSLNAMIEAEEMGLTQANIDQKSSSTDPAVQRFVGATGDLGKGLGLDNKWAYNIVKLVGNYGESFERNLTPLGFDRGINKLWNKGGILYAPPIR